MIEKTKKYYLITDLDYRYHGVQLKKGTNVPPPRTGDINEYRKFVFNGELILYDVNKHNRLGYLWDVSIPPGCKVSRVSETYCPQFESESIILSNPRRFDIDLLVGMLKDKDIVLTKSMLSDIFECFISNPDHIEKIILAVYSRGDMDFSMHDRTVLYHLIRTGCLSELLNIEQIFGSFPESVVYEILECASAFGQIDIIHSIARGSGEDVLKRYIDMLYSAAIRRDQLAVIEYFRMCGYMYTSPDELVHSLIYANNESTLATLIRMDERWCDPGILNPHKFKILYTGRQWLIRHFIESGVNYADRADIDEVLRTIIPNGHRFDTYRPILEQMGTSVLYEHVMKIYMSCLISIGNSQKYLKYLYDNYLIDFFDSDLRCHITEDMMFDNDSWEIFKLYIESRVEPLQIPKERLLKLVDDGANGIIDVILRSEYIDSETREILDDILENKS